MINVKWISEDQESKLNDRSRAKITELRLGTSKRVVSPSRGIKVSKSASDFSLWNEFTGDILPPIGLGFIHMKITSETMSNLIHTNGKFNGKVSEATATLTKVDDSVVKTLYPRVPKTQAEKVEFSIESIKASLDFLNNSTENDMNLLPIPPLEDTGVLDNFQMIRDGVNEVYETTSGPNPLVGYIPAIEDPTVAAQVALEYTKDMPHEINVFVVDFANGRRERSVNEIHRALIQKHDRGEIGDFYLHAVNVRKDKVATDSFSPIYDLPLSVQGVDSFNNLLYSGGSSKKRPETVQETNRRKRYPVGSQYGSFNYAELISRGLPEEQCPCRVCQEHDMEGLYDTPNHDDFLNKLNVHRMFLQMSETEEYGQILRESGSLLDYLREKPMVKDDVDRMVRESLL